MARDSLEPVFRRSSNRFRLGAVAYWRRSTLPEVRYSASADARVAQELADYLTKEFAGQGIRLRLTVVSDANRREQTYSSVQRNVAVRTPRTLEVWLPPLRSPASK